MTEPTAEMIEAGLGVLREWLCDSPLGRRDDPLRAMANDVYRVMQAARPEPVLGEDLEDN